MNIRILSLGLLLGSAAIMAQKPADDPSTKALESLSRIEALYLPRLSPDERKLAVQLMNEARSSLVELSARPTEPPKLNHLNVLGDSAFQKLLASVKKENLGSGKTRLVLAIGRKGRITSAQVAALVQTYSFDSERTELLKALADNILDPVNIGMALEHYDNAILRDEMAAFFRDR